MIDVVASMSSDHSVMTESMLEFAGSDGLRDIAVALRGKGAPTHEVVFDAASFASGDKNIDLRPLDIKGMLNAAADKYENETGREIYADDDLPAIHDLLVPPSLFDASPELFKEEDLKNSTNSNIKSNLSKRHPGPAVHAFFWFPERASVPIVIQIS
jgi:hypothetical protein